MEFTTLSGIILLLLGLICIWQGWKNFRLARSSHSWLQVPGVINQVKIRKTHDPESLFDYEAEIIYSYTVGGLEYHCSTLAIGKERLELTERKSLNLHDQYPLHGPVRVFYDPSNPARAVLEPGKEGNSALLIAIGMGMFGYGCFALS